MIGQFSLFAVLAVALVAETVNSALAPAEAGEFPYQVSVRIHGSHACGGAIVGYGHIVTSAKCVVDLHTMDELVVVTGSLSSTNGGEIYKARKIAIHPDFKREKPDSNDIAIIVLERPIEYNADQGNVFLPSRHMPDDVVATLTGWRWDSYSLQSNAGYLKKIAVKTISSGECQRYEPTVNTTQICASVASGYGSCVGDVGAPLIYDQQLIGVLSEGNPCGGGIPGIFTSVSHYIDWMWDVINLGDLSLVPNE